MKLHCIAASSFFVCLWCSEGFQTKLYSLCVGNISYSFTVDDMKKLDFKEVIFLCDFSVDCNAIGLSDIVDNHKYLMKKITGYKRQGTIDFLSFVGSLTRVMKVSDRKKCILLNNQPSMTLPTQTDLNSDEITKF